MNKIMERFHLNGRLSLLLPYIIISSLFIITPLIMLLIKAFTPVSSTSDNWNVALSLSTWNIIGRSIWTGLAAGIICMIIAVPYSYYVSKLNNKFLKIISISLMISPLFIFTISKAFALRGTLIWMFDKSGKNLNNYGVLIIGLSYLYLPFFIIPVYSVFSNMPDSLTEASYDLGYSHTKTLFKIVIPYGLKAILSGLSLVFMLSATSIVVSEKLIPNGRNFKLIGNLIKDYANPVSKFDIATASTLSLISIGVITSMYMLIYVIPIIYKKIKGGSNA